jgi:hypothetical protein
MERKSKPPRRPYQKRKEPFLPFKKSTAREKLTEQESAICPTLEIIIPKAAHEDLKEFYFDTKVVLAFEGTTTQSQARDWIRGYTTQHAQQLRIYEPLASNLYVVEINSRSPARAIKRLWAISPLSLAEHNVKRASRSMIALQGVPLLDRFASVNYYSTSFRASNPIDFCHLVYFQIKEGSPSLYGLLDTIFLQFGKIMRRYMSYDIDNHRILVLVETTSRTSASKV